MVAPHVGCDANHCTAAPDRPHRCDGARRAGRQPAAAGRGPGGGGSERRAARQRAQSPGRARARHRDARALPGGGPERRACLVPALPLLPDGRARLAPGRPPWRPVRRSLSLACHRGRGRGDPPPGGFGAALPRARRDGRGAARTRGLGLDGGGPLDGRWAAAVAARSAGAGPQPGGIVPPRWCARDRFGTRVAGRMACHPGAGRPRRPGTPAGRSVREGFAVPPPHGGGPGGGCDGADPGGAGAGGAAPSSLPGTGRRHDRHATGAVDTPAPGSCQQRCGTCSHRLQPDVSRDRCHVRRKHLDPRSRGGLRYGSAT